MIKYTSFQEIPQFTDSGTYTVNVYWPNLEHALDLYIKNYKLDLDPDFQRAHVWSRSKQIAYVEFVLRGGRSARTLYFNCPGWGGRSKVHDTPQRMCLVDGKQRLEAVRLFMSNRLPVFGTKFKDFKGVLRMHAADFVFHVNDLDTREQILQWYIDINSGGVIHTPEEIRKVERLLAKERHGR